MPFDYTTLVFPAVLLSVFLIKYLVKRLYKIHFQKREAQRLENLNRLLINNPLLNSLNDPVGRVQAQTRENIHLRVPPPNYEIALTQFPTPAPPVFCIHIPDDAPPPTYSDYLKMNDESPPEYSVAQIQSKNSKNCSSTSTS